MKTPKSSSSYGTARSAISPIIRSKLSPAESWGVIGTTKSLEVETYDEPTGAIPICSNAGWAHDAIAPREAISSKASSSAGSGYSPTCASAGDHCARSAQITTDRVGEVLPRELFGRRVTGYICTGERAKQFP